jgi:hypothetical protein
MALARLLCSALWRRRSLLSVTLCLALSACDGGLTYSPAEDDLCSSQAADLTVVSIRSVLPEAIDGQADVVLTIVGTGFPETASVSLSASPCARPVLRTAQTLKVQCWSGEVGPQMLSVYANEPGRAPELVARAQVMVSSRNTKRKLAPSGGQVGTCYGLGSDHWVPCDSEAAQALSAFQEGMQAQPEPQFSSVLHASQSRAYPLEECVKDERSSLVWEGKTLDGWRAGQRLYTYYTQGLHDPFEQAMTEGNVDHHLMWVNQLKLCDFADWRVPSPEELQGLLNYGAAAPEAMVSSTFFPHTPAEARYWSAAPYADSVLLAWYVDFSSGVVSMAPRQEGLSLRLVRGSNDGPPRK